MDKATKAAKKLKYGDRRFRPRRGHHSDRDFSSRPGRRQKGLNKIADTLGPNRLARDSLRRSSSLSGQSTSVVARSMADHMRCYIHAAYSWGMKSDHDHRNTSCAASAFLTIQPQKFRPNPRSRARAGSTRKSSSNSIAGWNARYAGSSLLILALCSSSSLAGHCVDEIVRLHVNQWDAPERLIDWG